MGYVVSRHPDYLFSIRAELCSRCHLFKPACQFETTVRSFTTAVFAPGAGLPDRTALCRRRAYGRKNLMAGGASTIWVEDGHGSGNDQEPDILTDKMDQRARFDFRDRPYDPYSTGIDGSVDAIVCIGMHARARSIGFMAHTYTFDVAWKVNGVDLTETHIVAVSAARWGIPVIMVSGGGVLQEQLQSDFPELKYAVVKTGKR